MNSVATTVLASVIVLLAVFGGGVLVWTVTVAAIILCLTQLALLRRNGPPLSDEHCKCSTLEKIYALVLLFLIVFLIPIPFRMSPVMGRQRSEQNMAVARALRHAESMHLVDNHSPSFALTRNKAGSLRVTILWIAGFAAASVGAFLSLRNKRALLRTLVLTGGSIAGAGLVSLCLWPQGSTLCWVWPVPEVLPGPVACFVNPNHFAGFLAMLSPVAFVLLVGDGAHRQWPLAALSLLCFLLMTAGVALSFSAGALLAYVVGMLGAALAFCVHRRLMPSIALIALTVGMLCLLAYLRPSPAFSQGTRSLERHEETASLAARWNTWRSSLAVWWNYPLLGAGPNAFRMVYPQHRHTSESGHATHPENEYLQCLAETGCAGIALSLLLVLAVARQLRCAARTNSPDTIMATAVTGAVSAAAAHASVDFALHVPLYALVLASLLGVVLSPSMDQTPSPQHLPARSPAMAVTGLVILLLFSPLSRRMQVMDSPLFLMQSDSRDLARALIWAPTSWHAWYYLGRQACIRNDRLSCEFGEKCLSQAAAYDPNNYRLWKELGMLRLKLDNPQGARDAFGRVRHLRSWLRLPDVPEEPK